MRHIINLVLVYLFAFDRTWLNDLSEWDRLMYYTYRWNVLTWFLSVYIVQIVYRSYKKYSYLL